MSNENIRSPEKSSQGSIDPGPHLARVIRSEDNKYMGTLHVQLLRDVGNIPDSEASTYPVQYLSPFYGVTSITHLGNNNTFSDTQKSYGMWMIPPTEGGIVVVLFINGDASKGFWIGCVQDEYMNFMIPGLAATELNTQSPSKKLPVAEHNKNLTDGTKTDTTLIQKPVHPFSQVLTAQGLIDDEIRGTTTSSARRESPSNVFGISTPGPVDRGPGATRGKVGSKENPVSGAFVGRLGGFTLVMDDGDENFLRKTKAGEGPPEYASVENDEKGGKVDIPHNELFRIRTRTGHQILLHNSEDLIYIANARGTAWIELTSNGKIDVYAADSISLHTKNDLNITADRDINLTAGRHVNTKAGGHIWETSGGSNETKAGGNIVETAPNIHMNGPAAATAPAAGRIPQAEPWNGHENLNPTAHTPANSTAGGSAGTGVLKKILDTFKKIGK
jgi:hypothetical protein